MVGPTAVWRIWLSSGRRRLRHRWSGSRFRFVLVIVADETSIFVSWRKIQHLSYCEKLIFNSIRQCTSQKSIWDVELPSCMLIFLGLRGPFVNLILIELLNVWTTYLWIDNFENHMWKYQLLVSCVLKSGCTKWFLQMPWSPLVGLLSKGVVTRK